MGQVTSSRMNSSQMDKMFTFLGIDGDCKGVVKAGAGCSRILGGAETVGAASEVYARKLGAVLKMPPIKAGSDLSKWYRGGLPSLDNGKTITADEKSQRELAKSLGGFVKEMGGDISDDASVVNVCNEVTEFAVGATEAIAKIGGSAKDDVAQTLGNTRLLSKALRKVVEKIHSDNMSGDDHSLKLKSSSSTDFAKSLLEYLEKQIVILHQLTGNSVKKIGEDLAGMLSKSKDLRGLVKGIKSKAGTSPRGDALALVLEQLGIAGAAADRYNKALGDLGGLKSSATDRDIHLKTLDLLNKMQSGKSADEAIKKLFEMEGIVLGGRVPLKKKLNKQKKTRNLMLKSFKSKSKIFMDRVYKSIYEVAKKVGKGGIALSDDLYRFKTTLGDMSIVFTEGIEYALTGYHTHANAVEHKNRFISLLKAMIDVVSPLKSQASEFAGVESAITDLLKLIDTFSDTIKVYGSEPSARGGAGLIPDGSGISGIGGGFNVREMIDKGTKALKTAEDVVSAIGAGEFKAVVTLKNARNSFDHFYNIAKFKKNLKSVASEMKTYNKDYSVVVGAAVGKKIDTIRSELKRDRDALDDVSTGLGKSINDLKSANGTTDVTASSEGYSKESIMAIKTSFVAAKEKLYKVAQAVDIYLQRFTDEVAASPDDVREVSKLLGSVEIMANWFSEKSGDSIASLYELFPWNMMGFNINYNKKLETSVANLDKGVTNISADSHYYKLIGDHIASQTAVAAADNNNMHHGDDAKKLPANPFLPISPTRAKKVHKFAKYAVDKMYALKNIVAAFAYLGDKFGDVSLRSETFMTPNEIYKALMEYVYVSSLSMGWGDSDRMSIYGYKPVAGNDYAGASDKKLDFKGVDHVIAGDVKISSHCNGTGGDVTDAPNVHKGTFRIAPYFPDAWRVEYTNAGKGGYVDSNVGSNVYDGNADLRLCAHARHAYGVVMAGVEDDDDDSNDKDSISGWKSVFAKEDKVFVNIIKAMAAKVFTVTGLYNMLNFADGKNYAMNPTRLILGGGAKGGDSSFQTPKIYPDALELYARLPLLAEFYRDIFCFEEACKDDTRSAADDEALLISMVPEVGSMWAGFITCIFDQPHGTNGMYSDSVLKKIIHEINEVYLAYKSKGKDVVTAVITDFVAEINSRYGLMNRSEIKEYKKETNDRKNLYTIGNDDEVEDFDTLGEESRGSGIAPSDRYASVNTNSASSDYELDSGVYAALRTFRRRIDKRVESVTFRDRGNFDLADSIPDFSGMILSYKESLKTTDAVDERFKMVSRLVTGMDVKTQSNREANLMFHETVVLPLTTLTAITKMLERYEEGTHNWDAHSMFKALENLWNPDGADGNAGRLYQRWWFGQFRGGVAPVATVKWSALVRAIDNNGGVPNNIPVNMNDLGEVKTELEKITKGRNADGLIQRMLAGADTNVVDCTGRHVNFSNFLQNVDLTPRRHPVNSTYTMAGLRDVNPDHVGKLALINESKGEMSVSDDSYGPHRLVAYAGIRWPAVFKAVTNLVYGLTSDLGDLCEVNSQNGKLIISHGKLQTLCEETFATVRKNIDKFRGIIPSDTLRKYVGENVGNIGTVHWLQNTLFDNLFGDVTDQGLKRAHMRVTKVYQLLSNQYPEDSRWNVVYGGLVSLNPANLSEGSGHHDSNAMDKTGWSVDGTMSELTHYNTVTMSESGGANGADMKGKEPATREIRDSKTNFASGRSINAVWTGQDAFEYLMQDDPQVSGSGRAFTKHLFKARHDYYLQNTANGRSDAGFRGDTNVDDDASRTVIKPSDFKAVDGNVSKNDSGAGIMMKFNEVMAAFIRQFWDVGTSKIYASLIEVPANGPLNRAVFKAMGWPDLTCPMVSDTRGTSDGGIVLGNQNANFQLAGNNAAGDYKGWRDTWKSAIVAGTPLYGTPGVNSAYRHSGLTALSSAIKNMYPGQNSGVDAIAAPNIAGEWGKRMKRYYDAAVAFQTGIDGEFVAGWAGTVAADAKLQAKYKFPAGSDNISVADIALFKPGANNFGLGLGNDPSYQWAAGGVQNFSSGDWKHHETGAALAVDTAANPSTFLHVTLDDIAIFAISMKYIHRIKRVILNKAREVAYLNPAAMRTFVMKYVSTVLSADILESEKRRIKNVILMHRGYDVPDLVQQTINPSQQLRNHVDEKYGVAIENAARVTQAFIVNKVLNTYVEHCFKGFATEAVRNGVSMDPDGRTQDDNNAVNIADVVALATIMAEPVRNQSAVKWFDYIKRIATDCNLKVDDTTTPANIKRWSLTTIQFIRSHYRSGGSIPIERLVGLINEMAPAPVVARTIFNDLVNMTSREEGYVSVNDVKLYNDANAIDQTNGSVTLDQIGTLHGDENNNGQLTTVSFKTRLIGTGVSQMLIENNITGVMGRRSQHTPIDILDYSQIFHTYVAAGGGGVVPTARGGILINSRAGVDEAAAAIAANAVMTNGRNMRGLGALLSRAVGAYNVDPLISKSALKLRGDDGGYYMLAEIPRTIGDPEEILFASTAKAIRTALTETGRGGVKQNIVQSIAEVPLRMKEMYKAQLPIFKEMFELIVRRANLLKSMIKLNIGLGRKGHSDEGQVIAVDGVHGSVGAYCERDSKKSSMYYTSLMDKVVSAASSMMSACTGVMNELNDVPLFMETEENSITDFKNINRKLPFMPMSSMSVMFQPSNSPDSTADTMPVSTSINARTRDPSLGYPVGSVGDSGFAYNYGTRGVLHRYDLNPLVDHYPYMGDLFIKYNATSQGQKKMEPKAFSNQVARMTSLLRYVSNTKTYSTLFGASRHIVDVNMFNGADGFAPFQITKPMDAIASLTTSSDVDTSIGEVVGFLQGVTRSDMPINRHTSMIYNILDLNISPINVHAMRKEIPLANLYNYAYTFDSFTSEIVQSSIGEVGEIRTRRNINTHDVLALMCKHPYINVPKTVYYNQLASIVRGNSSIDMYGRPKFIADQLWNKVLLGTQRGDAADTNSRSAARRRDANYSNNDNDRAFRNEWNNGVALGPPPVVDAEISLHYLKSERNQTKAEAVSVMGPDGSQKGYLSELGRLRFDTKLARNLMFIANVQRIMNHKLGTELSKIRGPVVSSTAATNRKLTEYHDMETHNDLRID
jgi:hypothetical protein